MYRLTPSDQSRFSASAQTTQAARVKAHVSSTNDKQRHLTEWVHTDTQMYVWFNPLLCFFGSEGHVALDRNPGTGYDTLLL